MTRKAEYHPDGKEYGKPEPGLMVPVNRHEKASLPAPILRHFWAQPLMRSLPGAVIYGPTIRIVQKSDERLDWMRYAYGMVK